MKLNAWVWFLSTAGMLLGLSNCIGNESIEPFISSEVTRLLTADTFKTWTISTRIENGEEIPLPECFLENQTIFNVTGEEDRLDVIGAPISCNTSSSDTLSSFTWEITTNLRGEFTDTLSLNSVTTGNQEIRIVQLLTSQQLRWAFTDTGADGGTVQIEEFYVIK